MISGNQDIVEITRKSVRKSWRKSLLRKSLGKSRLARARCISSSFELFRSFILIVFNVKFALNLILNISGSCQEHAIFYANFFNCGNQITESGSSKILLVVVGAPVGKNKYELELEAPSSFATDY